MPIHMVMLNLSFRVGDILSLFQLSAEYELSKLLAANCGLINTLRRI